MREKTKYTEYLIFSLILLLLGIGVYWDFLSLNKLLIYADQASDAKNLTWPFYAGLCDGSSDWSFKLGLGQPNPAGHMPSLFSLVALLFHDKKLLAFAFVYIALLHLWLAGIFFYLYLRAVGISKYAATIGALAYAYSGQMILLGGWCPAYQAQLAGAAFLLYAFERFLQKKQWFLLPLFVALFHFDVIYLYFYFVTPVW